MLLGRRHRQVKADSMHYKGVFDFYETNVLCRSDSSAPVQSHT